jgi:hypothetical protein
VLGLRVVSPCSAAITSLPVHSNKPALAACTNSVVQVFVSPPRSLLCGFDLSCHGVLEGVGKILLALCATGSQQAKVVATSLLPLITDAAILSQPESYPRKLLCGLVGRCLSQAWHSDHRIVLVDAIEVGNRAMWTSQPARRLLRDDGTLRTFIEALANVMDIEASCYTTDGSLQLLQESSNWLLEVFAEMLRSCKDKDWGVDESEFTFGGMVPHVDPAVTAASSPLKPCVCRCCAFLIPCTSCSVAYFS